MTSFETIGFQPRKGLFEVCKRLNPSPGCILCDRITIRNFLSSTTPFEGHKDTPILGIVKAIYGRRCFSFHYNWKPFLSATRGFLTLLLFAAELVVDRQWQIGQPAPAGLRSGHHTEDNWDRDRTAGPGSNAGSQSSWLLLPLSPGTSWTSRTSWSQGQERRVRNWLIN